jgi:ribosomal-protein-alanine N-acetyltransferase
MPLILKGERVQLRQGGPDEAAEVIRFYRDNERHLGPFEPRREPSFFDPEWWREQLRKRDEEARADKSLALFLFLNQDPARVIGSANLSNIVRRYFQACYLGYNLAKEHEGRGYMSEALGLVIAHAFGPMNLHRLMANYHPENVRSARVLERLGFVREGQAREYLFMNGKWHDSVLTSLTNPAWVETPNLGG